MVLIPERLRHILGKFRDVLSKSVVFSSLNLRFHPKVLSFDPLNKRVQIIDNVVST